jgi:hypothetical protein
MRRFGTRRAAPGTLCRPFAMVLHPRLSAGCPIRELDLEIVRLIGEQFVAPCWARGSED